MLRGAKALLIALFLSFPVPAFAADLLFAPGEERAFTRDSGIYVCNGDTFSEACLEPNVAATPYCQSPDTIGGPRSVACALETAFACVIGKDNVDPEVCRRVGGAPDPHCPPIRSMAVRYAIVAIYGLEEPGTWPSILPTLSDWHRYARIVFRAGFCRASWDCWQPDVAVYGDVEKVGGEWRFDDAGRQAWRRAPYLHQQLCDDRQ